MSTRRTKIFAVLAALGVLLAQRQARAEDPGDARCEGIHGLWAPLPDACIGGIDTDRPHQTDTPHVIPAGHTQVESAVGQVQLGSSPARVILFDNAYKFGLVSRVELELIMAHASYVPAQGRFDPPGPLSVRAKLNIVEERGWVPAMTLVPWLFVPVAPTEALRGGPLVFWGWELPAHLELEVNAGVLFATPPKPRAAAVVASALTYSVFDDFRVFIDVYATGNDVAAGTGALWAFARDMQVDLGTYVGLAGDEPTATPFLGFSVRR